jgi:threonine synthase
MLSYLSTRGVAPELTFSNALLAGLATDGGLYCPSEIPDLPAIRTDASYADTAAAVMWPFVQGSIDADDFERMVADAYRGFRHPDVCPIIELEENHHLLDLAQGPTLAFKDVALQLVGRMLDHELARRNQNVTVLGATSGDTGSAAIEALAGRENVKVVILHPLGRVSEVQRRQMTTVDAPNIRNVAVNGTFDDCQDLVKAAFNNLALRAEFGLAAVNSINWARVMAQIVYYANRKLRQHFGWLVCETNGTSDRSAGGRK